MSEPERAKILWHDLWLDVPIFGVAQFRGENVFYRYMGEKYYIYSFLDGESEKKAFSFHDEFRKENGGYQDHDGSKYSMATVKKVTTIRSFFDYDSHINKEPLARLSKSDFDNFYPPNKT